MPTSALWSVTDLPGIFRKIGAVCVGRCGHRPLQCAAQICCCLPDGQSRPPLQAACPNAAFSALPGGFLSGRILRIGGQSRPPLQGRVRGVVGADDSVGPLGSYEFAADFRKKQCILPGGAEPRPYQLRLHFNGFCVKRTVYASGRIFSSPVDFLYGTRYNCINTVNTVGRGSFS